MLARTSVRSVRLSEHIVFCIGICQNIFFERFDHQLYCRNIFCRIERSVRRNAFGIAHIKHFVCSVYIIIRRVGTIFASRMCKALDVFRFKFLFAGFSVKEFPRIVIGRFDDCRKRMSRISATIRTPFCSSAHILRHNAVIGIIAHVCDIFRISAKYCRIQESALCECGNISLVVFIKNHAVFLRNVSIIVRQELNAKRIFYKLKCSVHNTAVIVRVDKNVLPVCEDIETIGIECFFAQINVSVRSDSRRVKSCITDRNVCAFIRQYKSRIGYIRNFFAGYLAVIITNLFRRILLSCRIVCRQHNGIFRVGCKHIANLLTHIRLFVFIARCKRCKKGY